MQLDEGLEVTHSAVNPLSLNLREDIPMCLLGQTYPNSAKGMAT